MKIQLTTKQIRFIKKTLQNLFPKSQFYAFGSRAKKIAKRYSDLDVLIASPKKPSLLALSELEEILTESDLPFKVDIIDNHRVSAEFLKKIEQEAILL
jgi:predicted nucleotidyltransferase